MRSYIFTPLERKRIGTFLDGKLPTGDVNIRKIISRVRLFRELERDVDLYIMLREAITTASA